jgi:hypothetical protein
MRIDTIAAADPRILLITAGTAVTAAAVKNE